MIKRQPLIDLKGKEAGRSLEQYVFLEIMAYKTLHEKDFDITYWRTKTGIEVDFVLGEAEVAIEVKIMDHIQKSDLKGLSTFIQEYQSKKNYLVSLVPRPRKIEDEQGTIEVLPLKTFLERLWGHQII